MIKDGPRKTGPELEAKSSQRLVGPCASCDNSFRRQRWIKRNARSFHLSRAMCWKSNSQAWTVVVLKRRKPAESARPKLVRRKGRLVFVGEPLTTEEVNGILGDFPAVAE